jgi:hypothetical protein
MNTYIFFEEGQEELPEFKIEANNYEEAFDLAFECYGPQVNDLYYKCQTTIIPLQVNE